MKFYDRDIQIMRQSQSRMVLDYVNSIGVKLTVAELQRVADIFVECCLRPQDDDFKEKIKKLDKWLEEKNNSDGKR